MPDFEELFSLRTVDNLAHHTLKCGDRLVKYLFGEVPVLNMDRGHLGFTEDR